MSKPYNPKGEEYKFTVIKDGTKQYFIGTKKFLQSYAPLQIIKQEPIAKAPKPNGKD